MTTDAARRGWIEVISGSMFSGKTEELIRRLRRAQIAKQSVAIYKPHLDTRHDPNEIISHNRQRIESTVVSAPQEILELTNGAQVIGLDEAQFFPPEIVPVVKTLADQGTRVIIAGLDKDFRGLPFGSLPELMAEAEYVTKLLAICMRCGEAAGYTRRLTSDERQVVIGETDIYEARCRNCFQAPGDTS